MVRMAVRSGGYKLGVNLIVFKSAGDSTYSFLANLFSTIKGLCGKALLAGRVQSGAKITKYQLTASLYCVLYLRTLSLLVEECTTETKWPVAILGVKHRSICGAQVDSGIHSFNFCHQRASREVFATLE